MTFCPVLGVCCERFRERLGMKVVKALKRSNNGVIHAAVDMLCALMCVSTLLRWTAGFPSQESIVVHFLNCSHGNLFLQLAHPVY